MFRPLHTLKGLSGFIEGLHPVTELCQMIEGILDDLRKEKIKKGAEVVDVLLFATDELKKILNKVNQKRENSSEGFSIEMDDEIINEIESKISGIESDSSCKMPIKNNCLNGEIDKKLFDKYFQNTGNMTKNTEAVRDEKLQYIKIKEDEICSNKDEFDTIFALIIKLDGKYFAFVVKEFLGEQEFVLKSLPKNMKESEHLLGVTVDAEGNVIPVLNPVELIKRQFCKTVQK